MMGDDVDGLFADLEGDPFWEQAELMANAPPRPAKGYVVYSLAWLARVLPLVRSADQLAVAQLLYQHCLIRRSKTVGLPNGELRQLGVSRYTKYRALSVLEKAGVVPIETKNGQPTRVTLHWFP
jgi:hypothetical protein